MLLVSLNNIRQLFLLGDASAFDDEWRREAGRYGSSNGRALDYGRDRRAGGQQLALTAPPNSTSPPSHRHDSPRHRQPHTRPRYDWWEVRESVLSSLTWWLGWGCLALILLQIDNLFVFRIYIEPINAKNVSIITYLSNDSFLLL